MDELTFPKMPILQGFSRLSVAQVADSLVTLEYWQDGGWYVGRLREVPSVFSQGESLDELEEHIRDAYALVRERPSSQITLEAVILERSDLQP